MCREVDSRQCEAAIADVIETSAVESVDHDCGLPIVNLDRFDDLDYGSGVNGCGVHNRHGMEHILTYVRQ